MSVTDEQALKIKCDLETKLHAAAELAEKLENAGFSVSIQMRAERESVTLAGERKVLWGVAVSVERSI